MDIDSRSAERRGPRARLWMVFAAVSVFEVVLALAGLALVRVYDSQLIRQTESELLSQGAVVAEAYRMMLRNRLGPEGRLDYGTASREPWPFPRPQDSALRPLLPSLTASDPVRPAIAEPLTARMPAELPAAEAGLQLSPVLEQVGHQTLAGLRVVDSQGVVVATSSTGLGAQLGDREEVQAALRGRPTSILRRRQSDPTDAPLESLSRDTGVRVTVALPVLEAERVWGAVVLSRTPMTLAKAVYADRWNLTATLVVLLAVMGGVSVAAAALVVRPVRALVRQTRAIAQGDPSGFETVPSAVEELSHLSSALATTARALQERNQYILSFAANVSHEFKTPLSSIQGAVELLRESAAQMSDQQRDRFLGNVQKDAQRLTRLVQRLLELARADSMVARPAQAELGRVLASVQEQAQAEGISLVVPDCPVDARVQLPAEVAEAVLWQLVSNARQHGGEQVTVRLSLEAAAQGVRLRVQDDGRGISEANRRQVFEAFFTTARDKGGTGLGLTISQSMLRAFGARLELLPADGQGTCFVLALPSAPPSPGLTQRK